MSRTPQSPSIQILFVLLVVVLDALGYKALATPEAWAQPGPRELTLGFSTLGRPITAVQFGDGPRKLVVVGDTHGAPEANTYVLTTQLVEYFRARPDLVPESVRLYLIPTLNPDGLALGTRFNANGVDLNRNMNTGLDACAENDWRVRVQGARGIVSDTGGPYADSEVESRLIRDFLLDASGAIFIHSNAGLVFPAFCEHGPSIKLAQVYAAGAGYAYGRYWPNYFITGGMHDWAGSLGIAAITPELITGDQSEFEQNVNALIAVLAQAEALLPLPEDRVEAGLTVPALIWRFWKAHGGAERFGVPLAPASTQAGATRQVFERAVVELRLDQADTSQLVQLAPLGRARLAATGAEGAGGSCAGYAGPCAAFDQTGHTVRGAFLAAWERGGGLSLFGYPLSEERDSWAADGQRRAMQYFERAVFVFHADSGEVRLEPLGALLLLREQLDSPVLPHQPR